jgi:lysophospholipase L1-like esterase
MRFWRTVLVISLAINLVVLSSSLYRWMHRPTWWNGLKPNQIREKYLRELPEAPNSIAIVGDSNVEMGEWSELLGRHVLNRGIGGYGSPDIVRLVPDILRHRPQLVVLNIGGNDQDTLSTETTVANYRKIVDPLLAAGTKVIFLSIFPRDSNLKAGEEHWSNERARQLNGELKKLAAEKGCAYVDVFDKMLDSRGELDRQLHDGDGIHINAAGHRIAAEAVKPFLPPE